MESSNIRIASCVCSLIVAAVVIVVAAAQIVYGARMNFLASEWPVAEGRIKSIVVKPRSAKVIYSYVYQHQQYSGRTLSFVMRGSIREKQHILDTYRKGMAVDIHVNPEYPKQSVVEVRAPIIEYVKNNLVVTATLVVFSIIVASLTRREFKHRCKHKDGQNDY